MKYPGLTVFEVQGFNTHLASEEDLLVKHKDRDMWGMETSHF